MLNILSVFAFLGAGFGLLQIQQRTDSTKVYSDKDVQITVQLSHKHEVDTSCTPCSANTLNGCRE